MAKKAKRSAAVRKRDRGGAKRSRIVELKWLDDSKNRRRKAKKPLNRKAPRVATKRKKRRAVSVFSVAIRELRRAIGFGFVRVEKIPKSRIWQRVGHIDFRSDVTWSDLSGLKQLLSDGVEFVRLAALLGRSRASRIVCTMNDLVARGKRGWSDEFTISETSGWEVALGSLAEAVDPDSPSSFSARYNEGNRKTRKILRLMFFWSDNDVIDGKLDLTADLAAH